MIYVQENVAALVLIIRVLSMDELEPKALQAAKVFYVRRVYPMLTPVTVDPSRRFPHVFTRVNSLGCKLSEVQTIHQPLDVL